MIADDVFMCIYGRMAWIGTGSLCTSYTNIWYEMCAIVVAQSVPWAATAAAEGGEIMC